MTPIDSGKVAPTPAIHVLEAPARQIAIHLSLDVVDRLLQEVMRGFGAVPRRGAEVGGILLGSAERRDKLNVHITEFAVVPIQYKRGPSYLLTEEDLADFGTALDRHRAYQDPSRLPVGFFRSHTRDGVGLSAEDLNLLAVYFPRPESVALLIRPFASKVSTGGFYFREGGVFPQGTPPSLEFPFRRRELAPEENATATTAPERRESRPPAPPPPAPPLPVSTEEPVVRPAPQPAMSQPEEPSYAPSYDLAPEQPKGRGWFWVPLSFIFLLLGVLLGFQAAVLMRAPSALERRDVFGLALTVTKSGDNLYVKWDRQSPAIRAAERGALIIEDGTFAKTLELDANQLQNGSVVYRHYSPGVHFLLQVSLSSRETVTESVEWKE